MFSGWFPHLTCSRLLKASRITNELFLVSLLVLGQPTGRGVGCYLQALANRSSGIGELHLSSDCLTVVSVDLDWASRIRSWYLPSSCRSLGFFRRMASLVIVWTETRSLISIIDIGLSLSRESLKGFARKPFTNASTTISSWGFWRHTDTSKTV